MRHASCKNHLSRQAAFVEVDHDSKIDDLIREPIVPVFDKLRNWNKLVKRSLGSD